MDRVLVTAIKFSRKMAAPMKSESGASKSGSIPEHLDPRSPKFDPKRALYEKTIPTSLTTAKQFNNIAEFENFLQGKDAKSLKVKHQVEKKAEGEDGSLSIKAVRATAKQTERERKAAILSKVQNPAQQEIERKAKRVTSVFTKMKGFKQGPLSVLRKCVEERLRVVVVIRAAVAVRSHCRGYIIAFDKHLNMALMDVDEKYIRPVRKKETKDSSSDSRSLSVDRLSLTECQANIAMDNVPTGISSKREICASKTVTPISDLRQKLKSVQSAKTTSQHYHSDTEVVKLKEKHKDCLVTTKSAQSDGDCDSEKRTCETKQSQHRQAHYTPFWPLYKQWAEMRCYAQFEVVDRHVNQLFIRGDNVVSISVADS